MMMKMQLEIFEILRNIKQAVEAHDKIFREHPNLDEKKQLEYFANFVQENLDYIKNHLMNHCDESYG